LLEDRQQKLPIDVLVGKKNLEVRPLALNKGRIVKRLMRQYKDCDFALCIGDDRTDEDMFRSLFDIQKSSENGNKAKVMPLEGAGVQGEPVETQFYPEKIFTLVVDPDVKRKTSANFRTNSPNDVIEALADLASL